MADSKEKLFSDFPSVSTQEWLDKITVDLKGADFEKKLVWKTNEGFKVTENDRRTSRRIPIRKRNKKRRQYLVHTSGYKSH